MLLEEKKPSSCIALRVLFLNLYKQRQKFANCIYFTILAANICSGVIMNESISKQGSNNVASDIMYRCSSLSLIR